MASQRNAAKVCKVSRGSLERTLVSVKEGRPIGVVGRPRALTKEEEEKSVSMIDEAIKKKKNPTLSALQDMICILYTNITHIYALFTFLCVISNKCKDVYMSTPNKNLALGVPKFSKSYRDCFVKKHEFITRSSRPIEQVCLFMYVNVYLY